MSRQHVFRWLPLFLILVSLLASPNQSARAETPPTPPVQLELAAQLGGEITAVTSDGDLIYAALGPRLVVLTVADPAHPLVIGRSPVLGAAIRNLAVDGHYLYAVANQGEVRIIDVSNPTAPTEVGRFDAGGRPLTDLVARAGHVYAVGNSDLWVIDARDPAKPRQIAEVSRTGSSPCLAIALAGDYAYTACVRDGLRIVDVSTPSSAHEVGVYQPAGFQPSDIAVAGGRLYVTAGSLRILDLTNAVAPAPLGSYSSGAGAVRVAVSGSTAYIADDRSTVTAVDVANPTAPVMVGRKAFNYWPMNLATDGRYAYLVEDASLRILRVPKADEAPAGELVQAGRFVELGTVHDVATPVGNYVYVAATFGGWGLHVVDVRNPVAPADIGSFGRSWLAPDLEIIGNLAYVAEPEYTSGIHTFDLSQPATPKLLSYFTKVGNLEAGHLRAIEVRGSMAYVVDDDGLYTVDASDPTNPQAVGALSIPAIGDEDWHRDLWVDGERAYVVESSRHWKGGAYGGLWIVDVASPTKPVQLGFTDDLPALNVVVARGDYAYVGDDYGLWAVDVSIPDAAAVKGRCAAQGVRAITIDGDYAYVAGITGLTVVSISEPASPRPDAFFAIPSGATSVSVSGGYAYVGTNEGGLYVLKVQRGSTSPRIWLPILWSD